MDSQGTRPAAAERVARFTQRRLADQGMLERNPFFQALATGRLSRAAFVASQRQFYFAVVEFARPLLALAARLPQPGQRLGILDNVVEEHGHFDARRFHATTFRAFCAALQEDLPPENAVDDRPGPVVDAFNWALWGVCLAAPVPLACGCLGAIEWTFAQVSARIGQTAVERRWISSDRLTHYSLHAALDIEHAAQLFEPLESRWEEPRARAEGARGIDLGIELFDRLYDGLWRSTAGPAITGEAG